MAGAVSLDAAAPRLLEVISTGLGWQIAALWVVDDNEDVLRCVEFWTADRVRSTKTSEFETLTRMIRLPRGVGLPGRVWDKREATWVADIAADPDFPRAPAAASCDIHAGFGFPITSQGEVLGVVEAFTHTNERPDPTVARAVTAFGEQIGQFIERLRAEELLRVSETRQNAVLESALDCVIIMDHSGRVIEFNRAAEDTFGYRRDQVIGQQLAEMLIPPPLRELHYAGLRKYLDTGEGPVLGRRIEVKALRADGSEFPAELAITPVAVRGKVMFTGYLRDITERKRAEEERAELLEKEQQARAVAEAAQWRLAFLAEASTRIASTLDFQAALESLADLLVPTLGDWCLIDIESDNGQSRPLAIAHTDPGLRELADNLRSLMPQRPDPPATPDAPNAGSEVITDPDRLRAFITEREELRRAGVTSVRSAIRVPLVAGRRQLGCITLLTVESGRVFGEPELNLLADLARRAAIFIDNARLYQERSNVARALQRSLLPPHLPRIEGVELAVSYQAAAEGTQVGGDFYDVFRAGRRRWALVMGDVCGKGAEAASVTGLARWTLRATPVHSSPSRMLPHLNKAILEEGSEERFCTVALGLLENATDGVRITVTSGGHPLPLLRRANGSVEPIGEPGTLLGLLPHVTLTDTALDLDPGDVVVFYTDGVTDPGSDEAFTEVDLRRLIAGCAGMTPDEIADRIRTAAVEAQSGDPKDDIAVMVLRVPEVDASPVERILVEADIPGGLRAAQEARRRLDPLREEVGPDTLEDVRFLVNELVTNSIRHGRVGTDDTVRLSVRMLDDVLRVEVKDRGEGFEPGRRTKVSPQDSGWGLYLVERIADRWGVDTGDRCTVWFEVNLQSRDERGNRDTFVDAR